MLLDDLSSRWRALRESLEHSVRILVVDDEPSVCLTLTEALSQGGWQVEAVASVDEAWDRLTTQEYNLVLVDKNLKGTSGLDLLERMLKGNLDIPSVVMTAFPSVQTMVRALDFGAADYLTKPFDDIVQVRRRIGGVVQRQIYETFYRRVAEDLAHVLEGGSSGIISVERIGKALTAFKEHLRGATAALVLEKSSGAAELTCDALGAAGLSTKTASTAEEARRLAGGEGHILTAVVNTEVPGALTLFGELKEIDPLLEIVAVAGSAELGRSISALEAGASDFYFRSEEAPEVLQARVRRAAARSRRQRLHLHLVWTLYSAARALGHSAAIDLFEALPEAHRRYIRIRYLGDGGATRKEASPQVAAATRPERRRAPRYPTDLAVLYRTPHDPLGISPGRVLDVSEVGLFLHVEEPLPRGSRVSIEVLQDLAGPGRRIVLNGEIVRRVSYDPDPDEKSGVGIRFTDVEPEMVRAVVAAASGKKDR